MEDPWTISVGYISVALSEATHSNVVWFLLMALAHPINKIKKVVKLFLTKRLSMDYVPGADTIDDTGL